MRCPNCQSPLTPLVQAGSTASPYDAHGCAECRCTVVTSATGPAWSFPFLKTLVVSDEAASREVLAGMLEQLGCQVISAADAEAGLDMAFGEGPDIVFIDLTFAGSPYDGLEILRILKANERTRSITVFAVTAEPAPSRLLDAIEAGAADVLMKPFKRSQLIDLLVRHFSAPVAVGQA